MTDSKQNGLQPLADKIVVEVIEQEDVTAAGVIIPDAAQEKSQRGRVLAVGPGSRNRNGDYIPIDLQAGDEIVFAKYGGTEITVAITDQVLILRETDVLAKVSST